MNRKLSASTRNEAWIGDAVLALFSREWVLRDSNKTDGARQRAMSSNQFLSQFGNPTEVEATIGRLYQDEGLSAAFSWMENQLLPKFLAEEKRRIRQRR